MAPVLALIDGTGLLVRCDRAGVSQMHSGTVPTGPLTLFLRSLSYRMRQFRPTHVVVAWDGKNAKLARQKLWPGYKASRKPFSHGIHYELISSACAAAGMFQYFHDTAEADDVIACAWRAARATVPEAEIWIFSDDADLHQLVDEKTIQISTGEIAWDLDRVRAHYGCTGNDISLVRALAGDRSDEIPGIKGFGIKTASRFLSAHNWSLDKLPISGEDKDLAALFWSIISLESPSLRVTESMFRLTLGLAAEWDPEAAEPQLREFLERYEIASLLVRLDEGRLWR